MSSKALEYTKDIVSAKIANTGVSPNQQGGKIVAEFFEEIYNKIKELEDRDRPTTDMY